MLRTAVIRAARTVVRSNPGFTLVRPTCIRSVRFESTKTKPPLTKAEEALKAARERSDDMQRDWDARLIVYDELKPKTQSPSPDAFLIDVREPDEVMQGMIPSAVNLPLSVLANSLHLHHVNFEQQHGFPKPRKDQEVVFYCRSGMRSASACDVAKRNGYTNVLNYKGSWLEWVEKEGNKTS